MSHKYKWFSMNLSQLEISYEYRTTWVSSHGSNKCHFLRSRHIQANEYQTEISLPSHKPHEDHYLFVNSKMRLVSHHIAHAKNDLDLDPLSPYSDTPYSSGLRSSPSTSRGPPDARLQAAASCPPGWWLVPQQARAPGRLLRRGGLAQLASPARSLARSIIAPRARRQQQHPSAACKLSNQTRWVQKMLRFGSLAQPDAGYQSDPWLFVVESWNDFYISCRWTRLVSARKGQKWHGRCCLTAPVPSNGDNCVWI